MEHGRDGACAVHRPGVDDVVWERDIGKYPEGQGKQIMETLRGDSKYERIMRYVEDIKAYPTFKATWDEVSVSSRA